MIEYQKPHNSKHIYIKIIAWILIVVFTWNQIAFAGEFASMRPSATRPIEPIQIVDQILSEEAFKDEVQEVTNYDLFYYKNFL